MADMSLSHRDVSGSADVDRAGGLTAASPPATRLRVDRWRDPRLWLGVVLVLASVLAGAALFASADDTVPVWAVDTDLRAGMPITAGDVHVERVHFADASAVDGYLPASEQLPVGAVLTRDVSGGELVAVTAVRAAGVPLDQLPLGVAAAGLPAGLGAGDTVDVWAVPSSEGGANVKAAPRRVLDDVVVAAVGDRAAGGLDSAREILISLPDQTDVAGVLSGLRDAEVVLVRVGG